MSRFRSIAPVVGLILVIAGCSPASPSSAPVASAPPSTAPVASTAPSAAASASQAAAPSPAASQAFKGLNVNLLTFNGPQVAEPLQRRAPDFEKLTGAHINVIATGFQTIYDKALLDASTKTNSFDAYVFDPQWMGDFVGPGYLLDLTDKVNADASLNWQDIGPFFRDFNATYNGKVYTIPLDGDFHMVYYRSDLLAKDGLKPPATWDDVHDHREEVPGPGPQRRQPARLRLVHRQEEGRPELLVDHLGRGRPAPEPGHQSGCVLRHQGHDAAVRHERGDDQGPRPVQVDDHRRPAR